MVLKPSDRSKSRVPTNCSGPEGRQEVAFSKRNSYAQEGCRNGGAIPVLALVLAVEQFFQLFLQISGSTVPFRRFESIHGRPVVFSECMHKCHGGARIVEHKRVPGKGYLLGGNTSTGKSFYYVALDPRCYRVDEALWRWRCVGGADLQNLRHQRRIIGNPVAHNDSTSGPGHPYHLFGHFERFERKHRAKDAHDKIKRLVRHLMQVGRIAFLEPAVG